ncbi:MAG: hypothetical protein DWQ36_02570 [Acidobacteria bacterium]|nr:MAG: hypothetical protein DWQ30_23960 [Acidobacteriota bacterium]REK11368.1 MAG: hypothetical protein DWQ36_02570 [Acidobacteriota bacterium]
MRCPGSRGSTCRSEPRAATARRPPRRRARRPPPRRRRRTTRPRPRHPPTLGCERPAAPAPRPRSLLRPRSGSSR